MKWIKMGELESYYCKTPIGTYEIFPNNGKYDTNFGDEDISAEKDLETAKEDARIHLFTTFYKLKIFLELHE